MISSYHLVREAVKRHPDVDSQLNFIISKRVTEGVVLQITIPADLDEGMAQMAKELFRWGYITPQQVRSLCSCSYPTARAKLDRFRKVLGLPKRQHHKYSSINIRDLVFLHREPRKPKGVVI